MRSFSARQGMSFEQYFVCAEEPTSKLAAKDATLKEVMILALPMFFDLTATLLMSIGLL